MPAFHHRHHVSHGETGFVVAGTVFVLAVLCGLVRFGRKRKRPHAAAAMLDIGQANVLQRIERRKDNLGRYIKRLENQLEFRKSQLHHHEQIEQLVTARVDTARQERGEQDENWQVMMARGREVYGDAWDNPSDGSIPLKTLMTMHKDELYAIRQEAQAKVPKKTRRDKSVVKAEAIENQNRAMLSYNQSNIEQFNNGLIHGTTTTKGLKNSTALVHPHTQWTSHRRRVPVTTQTVELDVEGDWGSRSTTNAQPIVPVIPVPKLDFTKLTAATGLTSRQSEVMEQQATTASHRRNRLLAINKLRGKKT